MQSLGIPNHIESDSWETWYIFGRILLTMKLYALFLGIFCGIANASMTEEFSSIFTADMKRLECHQGTKSLSPAFHKAVEECNRRLSNIASLPCYKTCVFREMGLINNHERHQHYKGIDHGMIDVTLMESFRMETNEGRDNYHRISKINHMCGEIFNNHHGKQFAQKFDHEGDCEAGDFFFKCFTDSFKCQ